MYQFLHKYQFHHLDFANEMIFAFFFPNGQEASSAVELLSSGPVKKLEFLCEIKWQSNKIPAVTIYHTQH